VIRVTIDIVPGGEEAEKHTVRVIEIGNVTRQEDMRGPVHTYEAREVSGIWMGRELTKPHRFKHGRNDGLEACVRRALVALYGGETIHGARALYACTEHDDCREHPEVGVACWRERNEGKR